MYYQAFLVLVGGYYPDYLDADALVLGVRPLIQAKLFNLLHAQVTTDTLGEERVLCM